MFSQEFLLILAVVGLVWTGLGALVLISLLIKDWKNNNLW